MEKEFWLERWRTNQIGFHQADFNARLQRHWPSLGVPGDARVFVPLCGKSRDMLWLAQQGHSVLGVELSPTAIEAFFTEAGAPYERRQAGSLQSYEGERVGILCGDFFELTPIDLSDVVAVFDRGALVALPQRDAAPLRRASADDPSARRADPAADDRIRPASCIGAAIRGAARRGDGVVRRALWRCELLERTPAEQMPPRFQAHGIRTAGESTYRIVKER